MPKAHAETQVPVCILVDLGQNQKTKNHLTETVLH